jgi:hypothetical protein
MEFLILIGAMGASLWYLIGTRKIAITILTAGTLFFGVGVVDVVYNKYFAPPVQQVNWWEQDEKLIDKWWEKVDNEPVDWSKYTTK